MLQQIIETIREPLLEAAKNYGYVVVGGYLVKGIFYSMDRVRMKTKLEDEEITDRDYHEKMRFYKTKLILPFPFDLIYSMNEKKIQKWRNIQRSTK